MIRYDSHFNNYASAGIISDKHSRAKIQFSGVKVVGPIGKCCIKAKEFLKLYWLF